MYYIRLYVFELLFARILAVCSGTLLMTVLATLTTDAFAQANRSPEISGLIFADYDYIVTSPDGEFDGRNGFGYRRVYLTFDYPLSDHLDGRVRFEAKDSRTSEDGLPTPFIKDLYLRLQDFPAEGHSVMFGMHPVPNFQLSERTWGYRSLEKTIQDRADVVDSRDTGISFTGPINEDGTVRYRFMAANNSGIRPETDKFKRVYGAVEFRAPAGLRAALGADYYQLAMRTSTNLFAFVGFETQTSSAGFELFSNEVRIDAGPEPVTSGLSAFGTYSHAEGRTLIARIDLSGQSDLRLSTDVGYAIFGYAIDIDDRVEIIPNLEYWFTDGSDDSLVRARLTISATL